MSRSHRLPRRLLRRVLTLACLVAAATPTLARADKVTVKGTVLEGVVKSVTPKEVVMETIYGAGTITIPVADVQAIETSQPFHVYHGDDEKEVGPIVGISPTEMKVEEAGTTESVATADVWAARRDYGDEGNVIDWLRLELPYWTGNLDFGLSYNQATVDSFSIGGGIGLRRERGPSRLRIDTLARRGTQKSKGDDRELLVSEVYGIVRPEYDLTKRLFWYGSFEAEHDGVEEVAARLIPKSGLGYRIYESEKAWFAVDGGFGYVWERFFGGDTNSYPAAAFGAEHDWKLPFGAVWHSRVDYTPSLTSWTDDYLLRGETSLLFPFTDTLSFEVSLVDLYNSSPAEDTDRNSLSSLAGLSLGF